MHLINVGGVSQDDSTQQDSKPTVIALIDGYILPHSIQNKTYMWEAPAVTDMMGNAIATQTEAKVMTYMTYIYTIKLIRIKDKNDPLLNCNNSTQTIGLCLAPNIITNNSIIFESNGSFRTFKNDKINPFTVINKAIFYNYPQMLGKKRIFFSSTQNHVANIEKIINTPINQ